MILSFPFCNKNKDATATDSPPETKSSVVEFRARPPKEVPKKEGPSTHQTVDMTVIGLELVNGDTILGEYLDHTPQKKSVLNGRLGYDGTYVLRKCVKLHTFMHPDKEGGEAKADIAMIRTHPYNVNDFQIFSDQHVVVCFIPIPAMNQHYRSVVGV